MYVRTYMSKLMHTHVCMNVYACMNVCTYVCMYIPNTVQLSKFFEGQPNLYSLSEVLVISTG